MYLPWSSNVAPDALVSIVTPTYNRPELLKEAVASAAGQSYRHLEHIIVGDGCPVLESMLHELREINPELKAVNLDTEPGIQDYGPARIARLRNAGIRLARGGFVAHLDDDNRFKAEHIESLMESFRRRPDAAAAYSHRRLLIDGVKPYTCPCHPWSPTIEIGEQVWQAYCRMGIYTSGSEIMRDRITFHGERDCTVDTNELLVRVEAHLLHPFVERFSTAYMALNHGEDDVFCEQLYRVCYRLVCSGEVTLEFRVGGRFTQAVADELGG